MLTDADHRYMRIALTLAARGLGRVAPNPAVGCVLAKDGRIVGRGWTQPGGRPHAESEALGRAGAAAHGATAYISLEPCAHHGETAPCAEALVAAGIARVVFAIEDPDPRTSGRGANILRNAGIDLEEGCLADEARALNAGFICKTSAGRPFVTLKVAASLDGRIATASGESQWITGQAARARAHLLRGQHDAVMVGRGTAEADDPTLTCRLPGMADWSPLRVVADSKLRLKPASKLVQSAAEVPVLILTTAEPPYDLAGVEIVKVDGGPDGIDPAAALGALATRGVTRMLLEGGGQLSASFLKAGLVDQLAWFRAPMVIGGDGRAAIAALGVEQLAQAPAFEHLSSEIVGKDLLDFYSVRT